MVRRLAFRNEYGIAVIDIVQKVCLLNIGTPDLYGMPHLYVIYFFSNQLTAYTDYLSFLWILLTPSETAGNILFMNFHT